MPAPVAGSPASRSNVRGVAEARQGPPVGGGEHLHPVVLRVEHVEAAARSVATPPTTPRRPGSRRLARAPTVNCGVPDASKACTVPEYWSPTNTVEPPGDTATACGKRKTPPPFGGSPRTDGASVGPAASAIPVAGPRVAAAPRTARIPSNCDRTPQKRRGFRPDAYIFIPERMQAP